MVGLGDGAWKMASPSPPYPHTTPPNPSARANTDTHGARKAAAAPLQTAGDSAVEAESYLFMVLRGAPPNGGRTGQ